MACCSDIGTGAAANVVPSLLKKVVQELKMLISLPRAISELEGEVQRLIDLTLEINVELARVNMNPKSIVKGWLDRAGEAIENSGSIRSDYEQHKNCLTWCPNCVCRYRIRRRIRDWKSSVAQLHSQRQSDFPPSGEYGDSTPRTHVLVQNPESGSGFVLDRRRSAESEHVERLLPDEDSNIRRIGIQGMGGVGKTSLLDTINDSHRARDSFDLIIKLPEDKVIGCEKIIDLWIAEGLVKGSGDSYLHDKGRQFIKQLGNRCLIEVVENDVVGRIYSPKIHYVLRDVAIPRRSRGVTSKPRRA